MDNAKEIRRSEPSTPSVPKGKNYVLAIGIDDYNHHRSLSNAVADATAFVEVMTTRYGFEHLTLPLYNKEATQRNIRKAFGKCESLGEYDRLIVFYSGHGWYKTRAKLGYLVPTEAEDDPNSDFIPINFITDIFRAVKAHHVLLVVDCCFGGSFGLERNVSVAMTEKKISILDTKKSRMVLSSGGVELVSDGLVDENNSPFTKPLIEILKENQAPQMAFSEFFNLLCKKTIWNANQIPQYKVLQHLGHDDGELALYCTDLESPEERDYNKAIETENIALLEKFIRDYPTSEYKPAVRKLLTNRRAEQAWEKIKNSRHIEKFDEFIDDFPTHPLADLARQKIIDLEIADEEIEKQKRITEDNARKEKEGLEQLERKKQEEATRKKEEAEEKERLVQLQRKEQEEVTRKKEEAEEKERLVQLQRKEQEEATRKKEEAKEKERLVQLQRKEQEEVTRKKDETKEKEKLVQLQRKEQEEATRKKEEAKEKESQKQTFLLEPEMVFVKGGSFNRQYKYEGTEKFGFFGSSSKKVLKEGTQKVTLSDFSIGKYPITEAQWLAIMGYNSRNFLGCDNCPVVDVSWDDCQEFIKKLNEKTNKKYRLPTEAEWEFAARGGNQSKGYKYSGSDNLDEIGWYIRNSDGKTHPVGTKKANELGIYDMSGNVNEWCYDWEWSKYYGENYNTKDVIDPKGAEYGSSRVYRGGSRSNSEEYFSVYRVVFYSSFKPFVYYTSEVPGCSAIDIGFRVVLSP